MNITSVAPQANAGRERVDLNAVIAPNSIAIIGASGSAGGHSGRTLANLIRTGYKGRIYPVNPHYEQLSGFRCYPSVGDIGEPVDAAYIVVRADRVAAAVQECTAAGIRIITICSAGFAEEGEEGRLLQSTIASAARAAGSRVLGPNCIGSLSVAENVVACPTYNVTQSLTSGGIAIVSQSGGLAINLLNRAQGRGIGMRAFVSVGNESDLDATDILDAFTRDAETTVVCVFVEQLRDVPAFAAAVRRAKQAGKFVIVLKGGRSDAGQRNAASHTGSLAGSHAVFQGVMRQLGVLEVNTIDGMLDAASLLARGALPQGNRVLIVSPSGGECGYAADRATDLGLVVTPLSLETIVTLRASMRFGTPNNPLDLTGQVIGDAGLLRSVLDTLEHAPEFDMVLYAVPTWGPHDSDRLLPLFIDAAARSKKPTVIAAWSAMNLTERAEELLNAGSIAHFGSVDAALLALSNLALAGELSSTGLTEAAPQQPIESRRSIRGGASEAEAKDWLSEAGLTVSREIVVHDRDAALQAAQFVGWPIVVKQLCEGVIHKSDLGLVRLDVRGEAELMATMNELADIVATQGFTSQGVLLAAMSDGVEVIVGGVRDPDFGPVVMVGSGGVLAELIHDTVFRRCPITEQEAAAMISELKVSRQLAGYRGSTYDLESLTTLIARFSLVFASATFLQQVDLNPVIVPRPGQGGATIVDAAFVVAPPEGE